MRFCSNCGKPMAETAAFCGECGMPVQQSATPPVSPQYQPPAYGAPPVYMVTKPSVPGRGFGIASMVLGIIGVVYCFIIMMASIVCSVQLGELVRRSTYLYNETRLAMSGFIVAAAVYCVFGVLSVCFGATSRKKGYINGVSTSGLVLGTLSLIMCAVAIIVAAASL